MDYRLNLKNLSNPEEVARLITAISEIADECDILYLTSAPDGNVSARQGRICLYNNGGSFELWVNTDGAKAWQRVDYGAATDVKVKASSDDPTADYLDGKVDDATIQISAEKLAVKAIDAAKITTGTIGTARLGSGSASASNFLRGDQSWAAAGENNISNVVFSYALGGSVHVADTNGIVVNDSRNAATTEITPAYWGVKGTTYQTVIPSKFKKLAGVSTVTVYCSLWLSSAPGDNYAYCQVVIGSASGSVNGTLSQVNPENLSFTVDVSGLTNGTTYDVVIQLKTNNAAIAAYMSEIIGIAS